MAPLRSIPARARPITTMHGASAGAKRPLRAKASQIKQARPMERIVPSVERILEFRMISPKLRAYDYPLTLPSPPATGERQRGGPRRDASITRLEEGGERRGHGLVSEDSRRT